MKVERQLFVYWKVGREHAAAAHEAAAALLTTLREQHPQLEAQLLRRAEESADKLTFMETYQAPGGVGLEVQAAIEAQAAVTLAACGAPPRHVEVFVRLEGLG